MFTFKISDYIQQDADKQRGVELQISQALEVYEKIKSRKQLPNLWNRIDVLNEKCIPEEVLENREKRYKQYGVILIGLGSLCILLGDGTAQSLIFSLIIGGISIVLGCIYIKGKRKEPAKRIQKAASLLIESMQKAKVQSGEVLEIVFSKEGILQGKGMYIGYKSFEAVIEAKDIWVFAWENEVLILQKKDLVDDTSESFKRFIEKNHTIISL